MKRFSLLAVAAALAVVAVAVIAATGSAQTGGRTIVLKETTKGVTFKFVDQKPFTRVRKNTPAAVSLGDEIIIGNPLVDQTNAPVGRIEAVCSAVQVGRSPNAAVFLCRGVASLDDGDLFLAARLPISANSVNGAVTGGTGAYVGARGSFTSAGNPSTDTFTLLP